MSGGITEEEWRAELEALSVAASENTEGALTMEEICTVWGCSDRKARARVRRAMNAGRIKHVRISRTKINGIPYHADAYRLTRGGS